MPFIKSCGCLVSVKVCWWHQANEIRSYQGLGRGRAWVEIQQDSTDARVRCSCDGFALSSMERWQHAGLEQKQIKFHTAPSKTLAQAAHAQRYPNKPPPPPQHVILKMPSRHNNCNPLPLHIYLSCLQPPPPHAPSNICLDEPNYDSNVCVQSCLLSNSNSVPSERASRL